MEKIKNGKNKEIIEEAEELSQEFMEENQSQIQRQEFEIELPGGVLVNTKDLNDEAYTVAVMLQRIQVDLQNLANYVDQFEKARDHFRLKQKELHELINEGKTH